MAAIETCPADTSSASLQPGTGVRPRTPQARYGGDCLRDECVNVHQFLSLDHAKAVIEAWRIDYQ